MGLSNTTPSKENTKKVIVFNETEDTMPKNNPAVFELVWESFLSPPPSGLDADPDAKAQQKNGYTPTISVAGEGAPKTATLLIEKYEADPTHMSMKYHTTPRFLAAAQGHVDSLRCLL